MPRHLLPEHAAILAKYEHGPKPPIPKAGEVIGWHCVGSSKYEHIADGKGGKQDRLAVLNCHECGYAPPDLVEAWLACGPFSASAP